MVRAKAFICYAVTVGHIWHLEKYIFCMYTSYTE